MRRHNKRGVWSKLQSIILILALIAFVGLIYMLISGKLKDFIRELIRGLF